MREEQQKTIEEITFKVIPLGFKQSRKAFVRLAKAAGPALGKADSIASLKAGKDIGAVLEGLVDSVSDNDLEWFASVFGKTTRYSTDGEKWPFMTEANQETMFSGRLILFFRWLRFCLEVNYSDFLELLRSVETDAGSPGTKEESPEES